jgi:transcriptional regulator with XRE-family HTH domain
MDERIRELRLAGWSERRIAAELGVTRHRVRAALHDFRPPVLAQGATWVDEVGLALTGARYRPGDEEQMPLAELAYDAAEWLDARGEEHSNARPLAGSLRYVIEGVCSGPNPLVRVHARRARRLMAEPTATRPTRASAEPVS